MRILILTKMYPDVATPAVGTFIRSRAEMLTELGHGVSVFKAGFTRNRSFGIRAYETGINSKVPLYKVDGYKIPFFDCRLLPLMALCRHIKRERIELLHIHGGDLAEFGPLIRKLCNIPFVVTLHGDDIYTRPQNNPSFKRRLLKSLHRSDLAIFVSRYLLDISRNIGFNGKNVTILYNGVDTNLFASESKQLRDSVGYVGSLINRKRVHLLVPIFEALAQLRTTLNFLIVGEGPERQTLEYEFEKRGLSNRVHMTGAIEQKQVATLMGRMSVLVLPSDKESWGCVVKEAQAAGVMVVGSANGGIPEAVGQGGTCINDSENIVHDFVHAIDHLLKMPIEQTILKETCVGYDWKETVKKEAATLQSVIEGYAYGHV